MRVADYRKPASLTEAWRFWAEVPHARFIAGGTDMMVELRAGHERPVALISLRGIDELRGTDQKFDAGDGGDRDKRPPPRRGQRRAAERSTAADQHAGGPRPGRQYHDQLFVHRRRIYGPLRTSTDAFFSVGTT